MSDGHYVDSMRVIVPDLFDTAAYIRHDDAAMIIPMRSQDIGRHAAEVKLKMPWCETVFADTVYYTVSLSNKVLELHWNDVLVFLSPAYNGGLTFRSYQWYANGKAIEGAVQSWYYEPGMKMDTEYQVKVTMTDGTEIWVCPFTPEEAGGYVNDNTQKDAPKSVKRLQDGHLRIIRSDGTVYDARGRRITD